MPRANTLMKLRNSKVRRKKRAKSRKIGEARVLTYKYVNEGLQKLEDDETERKKRQLLAEAKKRAAEEKRSWQETLVAQCKADVAVYENLVLPAWCMQCTSIDVEWAATKQLGTKGR